MTDVLTGVEGIERRIPVDSSEMRPSCLVRCANGVYVRVSPSAHYLLRARAAGESFEKIAAAFSRPDTLVTAADAEAAHARVVARIRAVEARPARDGAFLVRVRLIPAGVVRLLAGWAARAYHPAVAPILAVAALATCVACIVLVPPVRLSPPNFWWGYALTLLVLVAHELGHAAACARFGAAPGHIGAAVYFIYPAFYSDVSAAWELTRWQRVVVDLGGVYFQLVATAALVCVYFSSGWEPLNAAVWFSLASCAFTLNPILRFDGYWLVADALGVLNLRKQPIRIVRWLWAMLRRRRGVTLPWSPIVSSILIAYTLATVVFLAVFLPFLWSWLKGAVSSLPVLIWDFEWAQLGQLAVALYVMGLLALLAWRLARAVFARRRNA
jgi:putative peptide zinc metalloprotease protein